MADIAEPAEGSLGELLRSVGRLFIETVMDVEVEQIVGARSKRNSGRDAIDGVRRPASALNRAPTGPKSAKQQGNPARQLRMAKHGWIIEARPPGTEAGTGTRAF